MRCGICNAVECRCAPTIGEYSEGLTVEIDCITLTDRDSTQRGHPIGSRRWVVRAFNEAGFNQTNVDIVDLVEWLRENKPELLECE